MNLNLSLTLLDVKLVTLKNSHDEGKKVAENSQQPFSWDIENI